jgi:hypothetical protein
MDEPRSELGYVDEFELEEDQLRSTSGDIVCVVTEALVEHLYRFEGPSGRPLRRLRKSRSVADRDGRSRCDGHRRDGHVRLGR